ncbi:MAG: prolipoprotein diacylglyceryl transferase family protein [Thermodesulfobacteriota bacterium]
MLYALLKGHISFPLLGWLLNGIYYSLILLGIVLAVAGVHGCLTGLGFPPKKVRLFISLAGILVLPAGLISSRAANMFYFPVEQWNFRFFLEQFAQGRHETFHASLLLPFLLVTLLLSRLQIDIRKGWDAVFMHIPLAHAVGRVGCLLVGCCWGREIRLAFMGREWRFDNPVPLYAVCLNLFLYWILRKTFRRQYAAGKPLAGVVAALYLILYGILRLGLDLLRRDPIVALGMTQAQIAMLGFIAFGLLLLIQALRQGRSP